MDLTDLTALSRSEFLAKITNVALARRPFVANVPFTPGGWGRNFSRESVEGEDEREGEDESWLNFRARFDRDVVRPYSL